MCVLDTRLGMYLLSLCIAFTGLSTSLYIILDNIIIYDALTRLLYYPLAILSWNYSKMNKAHIINPIWQDVLFIFAACISTALVMSGHGLWRSAFFNPTRRNSSRFAKTLADVICIMKLWIWLKYRYCTHCMTTSKAWPRDTGLLLRKLKSSWWLR